MATTVAELGRLGIATAPVVEVGDRATDPHLVAHEVLHVVHDPGIGRCRINFRIASWSRSEAVEPRTVPAVDTEVLKWLDRT